MSGDSESSLVPCAQAPKHDRVIAVYLFVMGKQNVLEAQLDIGGLAFTHFSYYKKKSKQKSKIVLPLTLNRLKRNQRL